MNSPMICSLCGTDDPRGSRHTWVFGRPVGSTAGSVTYGDFEHLTTVACPRCVSAERERRRPTLRIVLGGSAAVPLACVLIVSLAPGLRADPGNALAIGCGLILLPIVIALKWADPGSEAVALEAAFRWAAAKGLTAFYSVEDFEREKLRGGPAMRAPGEVPQKYVRLAAEKRQPPGART
jgi:hypothetical protein